MNNITQNPDSLACLVDVLQARISELELLEQSHRRAAEHFSNLFNLALDGLCIADIKTATFIRVNPSFSHLLGYSEDELTSRPFLDFIHPDDVPRTLESITSRLAKGRQLRNFRNRYRCRDGAYRWIEWMSQPRPEQGLAYAVARDVTDSINAEDALRLAKESLAALLNAIQEPAFLLDRAGIIVQHNRAMAIRFTAGGDGLRGKVIYDFLPGDVADRRRWHVEEVFRSGQAESFEDQREGLHYYTSIYPVFDGGGAVTEVAVYTHDITSLKEAQSIVQQNHLRTESIMKLFKAKSTSEQEVIQLALDEMRHLTGSDQAYLHWVHHESKDIELATWSKGSIQDKQPAEPVHISFEVAGEWADSVRLCLPMIHEDCSSGDMEQAFPTRGAEVRRHMSVPVCDGKKIVAIAGVANKQTPYDEKDAAQLLLFMSGMWSILKQMRAEEAFKRFSVEDHLTGLANRRRFSDVFDSEWRRSKRYGVPIALIFADIDHFKLYNDTFGHATGDACLTQVAACLRSTVNRAGDLVVRYGGEEFVVVLPNTPLEGAVVVAKEMRAAVESIGLVHPRSPISGRVTISLGVASCIASKHNSMATLLEAADKALYNAKDGGRNRVAVAPVADPRRSSV